MNWEAIKLIYIDILIHENKIEYLGEDRYKLINCNYISGKKDRECEYKNGLLHGKYIKWDSNGLKSWEMNFKNGRLVK